MDHFVTRVSCLSLCLVSSLQPRGHLSGKGRPLGSRVMFSCIVVTFPYGVLDVWYMIVSIPDICLLSYFHTYMYVF